MISIAPAAPRLDHIKPRIEQFGTHSTGSGGIDRRMFEQPDQLARRVVGDRGVALGHDAKRGAVIDARGFAANFDIPVCPCLGHGGCNGAATPTMQARRDENRFPCVRAIV